METISNPPIPEAKSSSPSCCDVIQHPTTYHHHTQEDRDMASCLILLSQGQSGGGPGAYSEQKFKGRSFIDTEPPTSSVYECKTCGKTFPSFQALGGHRTSHKKPKTLYHPPTHRHDHRTLQSNSDHDRISWIKGFFNASYNHHHPHHGSDIIDGPSCHRVHECSICGTQFSSGQALGGHMRRHRGGNSMDGGGAASRETAPADDEDHLRHDQQVEMMSGNVMPLDLDLNLPALPEDDDTRIRKESEFHHFASKQQHRQLQQQQQQKTNTAAAAATA